MNRIFLEVHANNHIQTLQKQGVQSQARKAAEGKAASPDRKNNVEHSTIRRALASLGWVFAK